jgi:hypothetical protein
MLEQQLQTTTTAKVETPWRRMVSCVLAAGILSLVIARLSYQLEVGESLMSKTAFLAKEAIFYDGLQTHSLVNVSIVLFIMIFIFFSVYELLAFVIYKVIPHEQE